jgi:hypothetical protein
VVISARRSGASVAYRLLAGVLPGRPLGSEPFAWSSPLGGVSRHVNDGRPAQARSELDAALESGVLFHHNYDSESWALNELLLPSLARHGYRVVRMTRLDAAARIFSNLVCTALQCRDAHSLARWRERLRGGTPFPVIDEARVREAVRTELAYARWFEQEYDRHALPTLALCDREILHCGTAALAGVDRLYAFLGVDDRAARLGDSAALRIVLHGGHYTEALCQYVPALAHVLERIRCELRAGPATGADVRCEPSKPAEAA